MLRIKKISDFRNILKTHEKKIECANCLTLLCEKRCSQIELKLKVKMEDGRELSCMSKLFRLKLP